MQYKIANWVPETRLSIRVQNASQCINSIPNPFIDQRQDTLFPFGDICLITGDYYQLTFFYQLFKFERCSTNMKLGCLSLVFLISAAIGSPVPEIVWVTVTHYTTIKFGIDQYTHDFPLATSSVVAPTSSQVDVSPTSSFVSLAPTSTVIVSSPASTVIGSSPTSEVIVSTPTSAAIASSTSSAVIASSTTNAVIVSTTSSTESSSSTLSVSEFHGDGTFYDTGLGACGIYNVDTDYIVALSHSLFDNYTPGGNPNLNTLCGKKINAHYNGKTVQVTVTDRCEGCAYYDLDFSPSAFSQLADQDLGRIKITWDWA